MLDVHAPDHPVNGARDFFLHLFTITVGLLIALMLENAAEAIHHRHDRKEAESIIRRELIANREDIRNSEGQFKTELAGMTAVLTSLEKLSQGQAGALHEEEFVFHQAPIQDSAWRTANSTGVLSFMDYAEVQRFSDAYKEQDELDTIERQTLEDYLQLIPLLSRTGGNVSPEQAKAALPYAQHAVAHLNGMYFIGVGTLQGYEIALK